MIGFLNLVLQYNGYYVRFWLSRCRFDSCRDYEIRVQLSWWQRWSPKPEVGGSNPSTRASMELWCRWLFARWTENPEALVRLKVAPQICSYNSFMNCYFKFIICSYSTTVSASVFQTEDASSILVSCSIYNAVVVQLEVHIALPSQRLTRVRFSSTALIWVE